MPFFENAKGVTIHDSTFKDISGDYHHYDNSVVHKNSHNTTTTTTTGSHNDSSKRDTSKHDIHNAYKGPSHAFTGLMHQAGRGPVNLEAAGVHQQEPARKTELGARRLLRERAQNQFYTPRDLGYGNNGQSNPAASEEESSDDEEIRPAPPLFGRIQSDPSPASFSGTQPAEPQALPPRFKSNNPFRSMVMSDPALAHMPQPEPHPSAREGGSSYEAMEQ
ncbi:hypothetical protein Hypma_016292 [Hypsizygus marmoreus]|uniref:Uncharacterized protein n=1 Tax=Hypsizygus marmoreus TaxID=39966 RepID=A0A369J4D2_HYPMA|nr:hypothetical protein Hypma_016292 [Hypsizygus marmoreus]